MLMTRLYYMKKAIGWVRSCVRSSTLVIKRKDKFKNESIKCFYRDGESDVSLPQFLHIKETSSTPSGITSHFSDFGLRSLAHTFVRVWTATITKRRLHVYLIHIVLYFVLNHHFNSELHYWYLAIGEIPNNLDENQSRASTLQSQSCIQAGGTNACLPHYRHCLLCYFKLYVFAVYNYNISNYRTIII